MVVIESKRTLSFASVLNGRMPKHEFNNSMLHNLNSLNAHNMCVLLVHMRGTIPNA